MEEDKYIHALIVEDNATNQLLLSLILNDYGCDFIIAYDGAEAVEDYKRYKFDIIFMDINMPIMSGIEATKIIRKIEKHTNIHTPIIAITAQALPGSRKQFLEAGMDHYISKPYSADEIKDVLKRFIP